MTIITGFTKGENVWIAGDRMSSCANGDSSIVTRPKIFIMQVRKYFEDTSEPLSVDRIAEPIAIGYTSSFRMGQLLEFKFTPPNAGEDTDKYMHVHFIDAVMNVLHDNKFSSESNNVRSGGSFLIGFRGRLFVIQEDFSIVENVQPYAAIGCGAAYANGAMDALVNTSGLRDGERIVTSGIKSAIRFSAFCGINNEHIDVIKI